MNKIKLFAAGLLLSHILSGQPCIAEEKGAKPVPTHSNTQKSERKSELETTISTEYFNKYVLHGVCLSDGSVVQNFVTLKYGNFSGRLFLNQDTTQGLMNEADYKLTYTAKFPDVNCTIGVSRLTFPHTDMNESYEGFAQIRFNKLPFTPSIRTYQGIGTAGSYTCVDATHSFPAGDVMITLQTELGYNNKWVIQDRGLSHLQLSANAQIPLGKDVNLNLDVSASKAFLKGMSDEMQYGVGIRIRL